MKKLNIKSITKKKHNPYEDTETGKNIYVNLINQDFFAERPNEKWVTDITYIKTVKDGWTYLASVMDLCTRKIVGWHFSRKCTAKLAVKAVLDALNKQKHPDNVILHSDLGTQYTSVSVYNGHKSYIRK